MAGRIRLADYINFRQLCGLSTRPTKLLLNLQLLEKKPLRVAGRRQRELMDNTKDQLTGADVEWLAEEQTDHGRELVTQVGEGEKLIVEYLP